MPRRSINLFLYFNKPGYKLHRVQSKIPKPAYILRGASAEMAASSFFVWTCPITTMRRFRVRLN